MTARELAKLARHIIQTYPELLQALRRARIHLEQDPPAQPQSAAGDEHRRGRPEDRLHQGSRLRPGRLGGAERLAPDRGRQRAQDRRRSAPTRPRSCWNGASTISSRACCSPKARASPRPRSMAARRATCRWWRSGAVQLMVPRGAREKIIARVVYTGPVPAPVQKGQKIGMLKVWRGDVHGARSAAAGGRERRHRQSVAAAPSTPPRELVHRPVPRRHPAAIMRRKSAPAMRGERFAAGRLLDYRRACADDSSPSKAARAPASRPMRPAGAAACGARHRRRAHARARRLARRRDHPACAAVGRGQAARAERRGDPVRRGARRPCAHHHRAGAGARPLGDLRPLHRFDQGLSGHARPGRSDADPGRSNG